MTIQETFRKTYSTYKLSPLDAGILLSLALKMPRVYILAHPEKKLSAMQTKKFDSFCARRAKGEPIAYIAGKKEFFGFEFLVDNNVLIPRPETELLVEHVIENINLFFCHPRIQGDDKLTIIDVGTGSGNIIISIAKSIPKKLQKKINLYAIDISKKSLKVAKSNAKKNKVEKKIKFVQSNMLEYFLEKKIKPKNIFIVANLPYVSPALYKKNKNNLKYEPISALISQKNGLAHYVELVDQAKTLITSARGRSTFDGDHCSLFIEFSSEQKSDIACIIRGYWPKSKIVFSRDLAEKWRMAKVKV
jgi:release factor glutamine methyltransferase